MALNLNYRKASEVEVDAPSFLFLGGPGTGKTTLLGQAANHLMAIRGGQFLVLNMEPKQRSTTPALRNSNATVLDKPRWEEIMQVMTADYTKFRAGVAVDGLSGYARECMYDIKGVSSQDRLNIGKVFLPTLPDYYLLSERMVNHISTVISRGIPIIFTSLPKFDKDELSGEIFKSVNLTPKPSVDLPPLFTVCGLCEYIRAARDSWVVKFRPERGFPARDTLGKLPPEMTLDFAKIWDTLMSGEAVAGPAIAAPTNTGA